MSTIPLFGTYPASYVNKGSTRFFPVEMGCPFDPSYIGPTSTEAPNEQVTYRTAGTLSNLYCRVASNSLSTASTLTLRNNAANGNETVSIGSGGTGEFEDITNTDSINSGDKIDTQLITGSTGTSINVSSVRYLWTSSSNLVTKMGSTSNLSASAASVTTFYPWAGYLMGFATESQTQFTVRTAGILANFFLVVISNGRTSFTTFGSRKNGANGNLSVSVGSGVTGIFEDTINSDSVASGDLIDYFSTTGAHAKSIGFTTIASEFTSTNGLDFHSMTSNGSALFNANTVVNASLSGEMEVTANETAVQVKPGVNCTTSFLQSHVSSNSITTSTTIQFRKNAANGNQSISIGASSTGFFADSTDTDSISSTDEIDCVITMGTSGTLIQLNNIGILYSL